MCLEGNKNDTALKSNSWFWRLFSVRPSLVWAMAPSVQQVNYPPGWLLWRDSAPGCECWIGLPSSLAGRVGSLFNMSADFRCLVCKLGMVTLSSWGYFLWMKGNHIHKTPGGILAHCWPPVNYTSLCIRYMLYVFMHIRYFKALALVCWLKHLPCYSIIMPSKELGHARFIHFPAGSFF